MASTEDLAKISEALIKPVLHAQKANEHTFYIIEDNTKYQHLTKAPAKT